MVSSKTKGHETLGTLRREGRSPWFRSPVVGLWSFLSTDRHSLGLASSQHPTPSLISRPHHCQLCRSPMLPQAS